MDERIINYITILLEEYGYNMGEIIIDHTLPSRVNEINKDFELNITIRYERPSKRINTEKRR